MQSWPVSTRLAGACSLLRQTLPRLSASGLCQDRYSSRVNDCFRTGSMQEFEGKFALLKSFFKLKTVFNTLSAYREKQTTEKVAGEPKCSSIELMASASRLSFDVREFRTPKRAREWRLSFLNEKNNSNHIRNEAPCEQLETRKLVVTSSGAVCERAVDDNETFCRTFGIWPNRREALGLAELVQQIAGGVGRTWQQ